MGVKDLLPASLSKRHMTRKEDEEKNPLISLQQEMNKMFDRFFSDFRSDTLGKRFEVDFPKMDITETESFIEITADLPGIEKKNIQISVSDDILSIRGEKDVKLEEKDKNFYRRERTYGSFRREVVLPAEVESDKADASLKNGVLKINIPKKVDSKRKSKKIEINAD
jgi:HSP20 family protein